MVSTALTEVLLLMHQHSTSDHSMLGRQRCPYKHYHYKATGTTIRDCIFSVSLPR